VAMRDCSECARLRERSAALYAEFVAARDDLTMTEKDDPSIPVKKADVKRLRGLLREAYRLSDSHLDSHRSEITN
jgi:hypothetical protein